MQNVKCKIRCWVIWGAILSIIADRLFKWYAQNLPDGKVFTLAPGLHFGYYLNPALFFFPAWSWIPWVALIVLIALTTYYLLLTTSSRIALFPILLGGFSNVFDRFVYHGVIDYVEILGLAFINLSDILILLGMASLLCRFPRKSSLPHPQDESGIRN